MSNLGWLILSIIGGEIIIFFIFVLIRKLLLGKQEKDNKEKNKLTGASFSKGLLERSFIVICLIQNFSSALSLLGALKIATRIKDDEDKVSNDFFVMGNLVSVLFGIGYYILFKKLQGL